MDRNVNLRVVDGSKSSVALRKESVDRNSSARFARSACVVALRKESVDRNFFDVSLNYKEVSSLSARRAWIEMTLSARLLTSFWRRSPQGERG